MPDETLSLGTTELETPASQQVEQETPLTDSVEEQTVEGEEVADELDDFEYEGKQYKIPRVLRPKLDQLGHMDAHLTRGSQANSAKARELEERASRLDQQAQATEDDLNNRAMLQSINARLKQWDGMSWEQRQQWRNTDPAAHDEARDYADHLRNQKADIEKKISDADTKRTEDAKTDLSKRAQETFDWAKDKIKGFNKDLDAKVFAHVRELGVPEELIARNLSPVFYELAYTSMLGKQLLSRQAAPKPKPAPEPLATVTPKGTVPSSKPSDKDDIETWMKKKAREREQMRSRA